MTDLQLGFSLVDVIIFILLITPSHQVQVVLYYTIVLIIQLKKIN